MKPIIKFLLKTFYHLLIGCGLLFLILYLFSSFFKDYNSESYLLGVIDKHNNFQKRNTSKNIIVIGGSSNAFGINSNKLSSALNLNTMNFGVHGDIGVSFWISEATFEAKPGDIILASFEYELTQENLIYGGEELYQLFFQSNGEAVKYGNYTHLYNYLYHGGSVLRNNILSYINSPIKHKEAVYYRSAFDTLGDLQSQSFYNNSNWLNCSDSSHFKKSDFNSKNKYINRLIDFDNFCKGNNIDLLISFPPIALSSFNIVESNSLFKMLRKTGLNLINKPTDAVYCDTLFNGTNYHLTKHGRKINTNRLILEIKNAIARKK